MDAILNVLGILLNVAGVLVLFRYGMPYRTDHDDRHHILLESSPAGPSATTLRYRRFGNVGLAMTLLGAGLQVLAVLTG